MKTFPRMCFWCERKRIAYFGSPWEHASALYCGDTLVRICENERDIYKGATPLWCPLKDQGGEIE